jgi:hypothetical protein
MAAANTLMVTENKRQLIYNNNFLIDTAPLQVGGI